MILIKDFYNGQSLTPYVGNGAFSKSANLDITGQYGIVRINYLPVKAGGATIDELAGSFTQYDSQVYFATLGSKIYSLSVAEPNTNTLIGDGYGYFCEYWNGFLISNRLNVLYGRDGGGTWRILGSVLEYSMHHKMFCSKNDGKLYIANDRYVAKVVEVTGKTFNPADSTTYDVTLDALKLPKEYSVRSFGEIGTYLVVCAVYGTGNYSHTAYFLWDRLSTESSDAIYEIKEQDMTTILSQGNRLYITGGNDGNIYILTTSGIELFTTLPFDKDNNVDINISYFYRNQLAWWNNKLMVGVGSRGNTRITPAGIYSVSPDGKVNCEHLISTGEDGTNKEVIIGGLLAYDSDSLAYSWREEVGGVKTNGIDVIKTNAYRVPSYACYMESLLYSVGTKSEPKSFDRVEVVLARPLQTGEGVRIKYRTNTTGSWTTLDTRDYSTDGATTLIDMPGIHNLQEIQIRMELTTGTNSKNTPWVKEIRLVD